MEERSVMVPAVITAEETETRRTERQRQRPQLGRKKQRHRLRHKTVQNFLRGEKYAMQIIV